MRKRNEKERKKKEEQKRREEKTFNDHFKSQSTTERQYCLSMH